MSIAHIVIVCDCKCDEYHIVLEENKKSQDNSSPLLDIHFIISTIVKTEGILKHIY